MTRIKRFSKTSRLPVFTKTLCLKSDKAYSNSFFLSLSLKHKFKLAQLPSGTCQFAMSPILILTLLIHITYAHDFSRLNWTLKDHISSEILKFATFDLATRTDCRGKKLEVSVYEQIDSELGRQELKAGFEYVKSLVQLALPENLRKSCEHFRGEYGSECLGDLGKR